MSNIIFCRWLESNCRPLVLEGTSLPTDPQPLLINYNLMLLSFASFFALDIPFRKLIDAFPGSNWIFSKTIDGVLGIRTQGRRMVGADETTELWRPPHWNFYIKHPYLKWNFKIMLFCETFLTKNPCTCKSPNLWKIFPDPPAVWIDLLIFSSLAKIWKWFEIFEDLFKKN